MIWRDQIIMDTEMGPMVLYTFYGNFNDKRYHDTIYYLIEVFGYMRNPQDPALGAIRGEGTWVDERGSDD